MQIIMIVYIIVNRVNMCRTNTAIDQELFDLKRSPIVTPTMRPFVPSSYSAMFSSLEEHMVQFREVPVCPTEDFLFMNSDDLKCPTCGTLRSSCKVVFRYRLSLHQVT